MFDAPFPTTYGALERTLLEVGYAPTYGKNEFGITFVEYHHKQTGARIFLCAAPSEEALYNGDLLRAEHSIEWWGVADLKTFYRLLREATPAEMQAA